MNKITSGWFVAAALLASLSGCSDAEEEGPQDEIERESIDLAIVADSGAIQEHASLAMAPDGRLATTWTAKTADSSQVMVAFSEDGGNTWSAAQPLLSGELEGGVPSENASVAAGPDSAFYVAYQSQGAVYVARAEPKAADFASLISLGPGSSSQKPQIIVDESKQVHVLWTNKDAAGDVAYAMGAWPGINRAFAPMTNASRSSFCADEENRRLYVVYRDGDGVVQAVTKPEPTANWQASSRVRIADDADASYRPTCTAFGDQMWTAYVNSSQQIWIAETMLGEPAPIAYSPLTLDPGRPRMHARIARDDSGTLHVLHYATTGKDMDGLAALQRSTVDGREPLDTYVVGPADALGTEAWLEPSVVAGRDISGVFIESTWVGDVQTTEVRFFMRPLGSGSE